MIAITKIFSSQSDLYYGFRVITRGVWNMELFQQLKLFLASYTRVSKYINQVLEDLKGQRSRLQYSNKGGFSIWTLLMMDHSDRKFLRKRDPDQYFESRCNSILHNIPPDANKIPITSKHSQIILSNRSHVRHNTIIIWYKRTGIRTSIVSDHSWIETEHQQQKKF